MFDVALSPATPGYMWSAKDRGARADPWPEEAGDRWRVGDVGHGEVGEQLRCL